MKRAGRLLIAAATIFLMALALPLVMAVLLVVELAHDEADEVRW